MTKEIYITKRNGEKEKLNFEKIHKVLFWATGGLKNVSVSDIEMNAHLHLYDGITTSEIHMVLVKSASEMISERFPDYQYVASRLHIFYLRKEIFGEARDMPTIDEVIKTNIKKGVYDPEIINMYTSDELEILNDFIKHDRDFDFAYAGFRQLVDKYLLQNRTTGEIHETPQYMYMMISMILFSKYEGTRRLQFIRKFYNAISSFKINLPTPIMCGVRTPLRQYSSCTLIDVGDSMQSIMNSNTAVGYYTAQRAGIGLNFGRIRAQGAQIRSGEVVHTGVVPFLKMFEATTKSCTQNGVRGGSSTVHFPFWHLEIEDIIVLKNNKGTEDNRVRKMDYSIQFCRLFYKRVKEDGHLTLFSPHDVPDLYAAMFSGNNDAFEALYEKYEKSRGKRKKKISARKLFEDICKERVETGRIYIMNTDNSNAHSSFTDPIFQSNLCQEITLPTSPINNIDCDDGEIALCVLSAVNFGKTRLNELPVICDLIVRALDYIVDYQDYPVAAASKMKDRRSIGIGITNLAYYFAKNRVKYGSKESLELLDEYMEHMQYYCIKASVDLAKEFGPCKEVKRTKYGHGILPIDTYNKNVDSLHSRKLALDWEALRVDLKEHGIRNSALTAVMPAESSAVVSNATNGIEPPRSLMSIKKSKKGTLKQCVPDVNKIGQHYMTAWEMPSNDGYIEVCGVIQKYIDQAVSANHYYNPMYYDEGNIPLSVVMHDIMYHYSLGGKTLYYANTYDGKTDEVDAGCAGGACSV
ncbi:MAG: ribonucleoside-diphosphate reductase subunit alpha [Fibrobacterales bacterium]